MNIWIFYLGFGKIWIPEGRIKTCWRKLWIWLVGSYFLKLATTTIIWISIKFILFYYFSDLCTSLRKKIWEQLVHYCYNRFQYKAVANATSHAEHIPPSPFIFKPIVPPVYITSTLPNLLSITDFVSPSQPLLCSAISYKSKQT